jgi:hypothetical protein
MKREQKITLGRGAASRIELSSPSGFDEGERHTETTVYNLSTLKIGLPKRYVMCT